MGDNFFTDSTIIKNMFEAHIQFQASFSLITKEFNIRLIKEKANVILNNKLDQKIYNIEKVVEKPSESEIKSKWACIGHFIFQPTVFEVIPMLFLLSMVLFYRGCLSYDNELHMG